MIDYFRRLRLIISVIALHKCRSLIKMIDDSMEDGRKYVMMSKQTCLEGTKPKVKISAMTSGIGRNFTSYPVYAAPPVVNAILFCSLFSFILRETARCS